MEHVFGRFLLFFVTELKIEGLGEHIEAVLTTFKLKVLMEVLVFLVKLIHISEQVTAFSCSNFSFFLVLWKLHFPKHKFTALST
jgi:hypothetical protein